MKVKSLPSIRSAVQSLLYVNMGLKEGERLLVIGDTAGDGGELAGEVGGIAAALFPDSRTILFDPVGGHGQEPPGEVWQAVLGPEVVSELEEGGVLDALLSKSAGTDLQAAAARILEREGRALVDVVVALTRYSISHTSFRRLLTQLCGVRFASMPLFEREMFFGPMDLDWQRLARSTHALGRALEGADRCEVRAANGTDIVFGLSGRVFRIDDGLLGEPGSFGNLPAGEVFIAPLEGTAEGVLVLDWGPTARLRKPLTVRVQSGRAVSVEGGERKEVRWLEDALSAHPGNSNVAELGIGTNPRASRPDNVLESEKILGTVHVAFGDNHTFGGEVTAPFHQDFVVFGATLTAVWERGGGRRVLLDDGRKGW